MLLFNVSEISHNQFSGLMLLYITEEVKQPFTAQIKFHSHLNLSVRLTKGLFMHLFLWGFLHQKKAGIMNLIS